MRRTLLILFLFTCAFGNSQEFKITKVNGWNVRLFNSRVIINDDVMSFTYRKRPPRNIKIFNIEVENDKKYFYAEAKPPVEESYYILYNDGKRTILENYLVVDGEKIEIKMRLSKID